MSEFAKYSTLLDMKNFEILGFRAVGMFLWWWCWGDGVKMSATMVDRRRKFWNQLDFTYSNLSLLDLRGGGSETVLNTLAHD